MLQLGFKDLKYNAFLREIQRSEAMLSFFQMVNSNVPLRSLLAELIIKT